MKPAMSKPCQACPWRISNQGKRHPGGWYTKKNLARLWAGMRRGERMTCHPTDETNPLPPGFDPVPEHVEVHECAGALVLKQREFMRAQEVVLRTGSFAEYRRASPRGITQDGMARQISDEMPAPFGNASENCPAPRHLDLLTEDVGWEAVPPMTAEEASRLRVSLAALDSEQRRQREAAAS